jgi:hypothetical protein
MPALSLLILIKYSNKQYIHTLNLKHHERLIKINFREKMIEISKISKTKRKLIYLIRQIIYLVDAGEK